MVLEISESQVVVGRWYNFNEFNLPREKYYDTGVEPKYLYLFMQEESPECGGGTYYWIEDTLPYGIDTFKRCSGNVYWMAISKHAKNDL